MLVSIVAGAAATAALLGLCGPAMAAAPAKPAAHDSCFFSSSWQGWHAPNDNTIYLRVNVRDIYRVDLSSGSSLLTWPDAHLINVMRGSNAICSPLDLDLRVADTGGMRDFVIAKSITKLTPEEVALIPKKDLP
jgi:hypothetical protein